MAKKRKSVDARSAAKARPPRVRDVFQPRPKNLRSKITNHRTLLPNIDMRSALARRLQDIASEIAIDLGGADRLSAVKRHLVVRFAGAAALAEQLEAKIANGQQIDIAEHAALTSSLVRIANKIGVARAMKRVPDLRDYIEGKATFDDHDLDDQDRER
ncbi:hypothetical protein [Pseudorhodoplanes sp.]|uniref:hypothetical protein n=1 Tax=Pseudorhodoplanes sp. TaxID=1934341 RepID=UPI003D0A2F2D